LEEGVGIAQISQVFGLSLSSETTVAGLIEQIKQVIDREIAKIDEIVANRPMQS
jgi:lambda repressor-like predicted transcriptional regulator